jgi:hypothetical protein
MPLHSIEKAFYYGRALGGELPSCKKYLDFHYPKRDNWMSFDGALRRLSRDGRFSIAQMWPHPVGSQFREYCRYKYPTAQAGIPHRE